MRPVPEWAPHEASLLCWPGRAEVWGDLIDVARDEYAGLARLLSEYEPVIVFANERDAREASKLCGSVVEVVPMPSDDAWLRDTGPIFCRREDGRLVAAVLQFNAWGSKYEPHRDDASLAYAIASYLGLETQEVGVVGEGGALATDGRRIITTLSVLVNENRNPGLVRDDIEERLRSGLGAEEVLWVSRGLRDDLDTDGHIDNLLWLSDESTAFVLDVPAEHADLPVITELRLLLERAGINVVPVPDGYRTGPIADSRAPLSMLNCYALNGALVVPIPHADDAAVAVERFQPYLDSREVRPFVSPVMAFGGGGAHCVALGLPA